MASSHQIVPVTDRLISIIAYFIPFLSGVAHGRHLLRTFPTLELILDPFVPLLTFYKSIPGVALLTLFGLYAGVVRDRKFGRFARFNALQAFLLELLMNLIPSLLHLIFSQRDGLGLEFLKTAHSALFVVILACFLYALGLCLLGKIPYFPHITEATDWKLCREDYSL
ncbi:hypothetical protein IFM89_013315 [Coptis chinensis]|uniref:Protein TIC 20 n=1 Tax=Coptis chinensis TaxID=261450 RepID=A0A835LIF1_9MAGN|nr:hypothetical protein IFM89_013315 [Coptis chinensis]